MLSAPEHAEHLAELWMKLPTESRECLMYRWLDRGVRVHAAKAFEVLGHRDIGKRMQDLSEITSEDGRSRASAELSAAVKAIGIPAGSIEVMACIFGVLSMLGRDVVAKLPMGGRPDGHLFMVCVGIVTAAR